LVKLILNNFPPYKGGIFILYEYLYIMELWKRLASDSIEKQRILNLYFELREEFKRLGFSEEDLEKPPHYSQKMWQLKSIIDSNLNSLLKKVNDYGFDVSVKDLAEYMEPELAKINDLTPLNDGGKKRDDSRDEDY